MKKPHTYSVLSLLTPSGARSKASMPLATKHVATAADIREEKVKAIQKALADGTWKPDPREIAEKMLLEHLFNPKI